jgi:aminotransferase
MATATRPASRLGLSEISPRIMQSEIRSMTVECDRMGGVNLAQGVCDTPLPVSVEEAAIRAIEDGHNIYTRLDGIALLREAIAVKLAHYNGLTVDPHSEVLVTSGATGALYATLLALLNPGEGVVMFEPFYGYHLNTLLSMRLEPVLIPMAKGTWAIDFDLVRASITPNTRAIIINTPSNPCGKVFTRTELETLAEIVAEHDLFVITDEIYEYFLFDGTEHISPATIPGMKERTISISGFSKTFSITGWRAGYLTASKDWLPSIAYFHDLTYVCAPSPAQYGAAAGLSQLGDEFYETLSTEYGKKRDQLCSALTDAGMIPFVPPGAYYVLADATAIAGADAKQKARTLLKETGIASVAGSAFFGLDADGKNRGENLLRFCFAKKQPDLDRACEALRGHQLGR